MVDRICGKIARAGICYINEPACRIYSNCDGSRSSSYQLTFRPLVALNPHWSPDGKRILFVARRLGEIEKLYTIAADGGVPEIVLPQSLAQTDPNWSPDGDSIIYSLHQPGYGVNQPGWSEDVYRIRAKKGLPQKIPGTSRLLYPLLSPDGRNLAAKSLDGEQEYIVVELKTGKRTVLSKRKVDDLAWSPDSQYIYFYTHHTLTPDKPALYRVHVSDGKEEKITDVLVPTTGIWGFWMGLAPDGSPLLLRDRDQTDVYALSLAAP